MRHFAFLALSLAESFGYNFLQVFHRFERIRPYCFQCGDCALIQVGPHHFDQAKSGESFLTRQNPYFGAKAICPANKLCSGTSMQPELVDDRDFSLCANPVACFYHRHNSLNRSDNADEPADQVAGFCFFMSELSHPALVCCDLMAVWGACHRRPRWGHNFRPAAGSRENGPPAPFSSLIGTAKLACLAAACAG